MTKTIRNFFTVVGVLLASALIAQDTTWVQTFTFEDITKRRDTYTFPDGSGSYRKVLMYYNLKCDAQTTQDNFACGEWDYLTYTNLYYPTGEIDSNQLTHPRFRYGLGAPDTLRYVTQLDNDILRESITHNTIVSSENVVEAIVGSGTQNLDLFSNNVGTAKSQFVFSKEELLASGLVAGEIDVLSLNVNSGLGSDRRLKISMATQIGSTLDEFDMETTQVFDGYVGIAQTGWFDVVLDTPFDWSGSNSIVLEIAFDDAEGAVLQLKGDEVGDGAGLVLDGANRAFDFQRNDFMEMDVDALAAEISEAVTVSFWSYGSADLPFNTSTFEAVDESGTRILNSHTPWGNGQVYWDAGASGYDRINKAQTEDKFKGQWNHYAFVKDASTGNMRVYINGSPRITGASKNKLMEGIARFVIGSGNNGNAYGGLMDEFRLFNVEVERATIQDYMFKPVDASHPNYANLLRYYHFDEATGFTAVDEVSGKNATVNGSSNWVQLSADKAFFGAVATSQRPQVKFGMGDYVMDQTTETIDTPIPFTPSIVKYYEVSPDEKSILLDQELEVYVREAKFVFDEDGTILEETPLNYTEIENEDLIYYSEPFDVTETIEIGRYITPYGINLDLGPQGFVWLFDVTEYLPYLQGDVEISAGNQQELIDLKFAFIHGTEPRDFLGMEQVWGARRSYSYGNLDNDVDVQNTTVDLHNDAESFKFRARLTGHGHNSSDGNYPHCCEWKDNNHYLYVNGEEVADFKIWRTTECGENPVYPQGGTWPGAREGWCPGDVVWNYDYEITPFVTGNTVDLDYDITPVPANNQGMAGGNYQAVFQLFQYGPAKFQNDVEIYDVINPNDWEYYSRRSNVCEAPKVVVRNNSASDLSSIVFTYFVKGGTPETYNWSGNIGPWELAEIDLPIASADFWRGTAENIFTVQVSQPNGEADENAENDVYSTHFERPDVLPRQVVIELRTNNIPGHNSYKVVDAAGNVVLSRGGFSANKMYRDTLDLEVGCYHLELLDQGHDGLSYWAYPEQGNGYIQIKSMSGSNLKAFESEFGYKLNYSWQAGETLFVGENWVNKALEVFPNPSSGNVHIRLNEVVSGDKLEIRNTLGQVVFEKTSVSPFSMFSLELNDLAPGLYSIILPKTGSVKQLIIE